jgi:hypothetical protein
MSSKPGGDNPESTALFVKTDANKNITNGGRGSGSTRGRGRGRGSGSRPLYYCTHCNKAGHSNERCWELHPHLRRDNGMEKVAALASTPDTIKQDPTEIQSLHDRIRQLEQYIQGNTSNHDTSLASVAHTSGNIRAFLSTSNSKVWLVDSGATDNMASHSHMLSNVKASYPKQFIGIADGTRVPVEGTGKMNLFSSMTDALFIPSLSSNLLSVSKITKQLNCNVTFSPYDVVFQDRTTGMLLGKGKEIGGLYVMDTASLSNAFSARLTKEETSLLWHRRLGLRTFFFEIG